MTFLICVQFLQNFNIYKHLCVEVYGSQLEGASGYTTYATLRNILLNLVYHMAFWLMVMSQ